MSQNEVGEIYLNSIDRDGTGQGYDFTLLNFLPEDIVKPIIFGGGAGNASHLISGLHNAKVDAVATAHLFNFIGDGLSKARKNILEKNIKLAKWPNLEEFYSLEY